MNVQYMTDEQIRGYLRTTKPNGQNVVTNNAQSSRIEAINELVKRDTLHQMHNQNNRNMNRNN